MVPEGSLSAKGRQGAAGATQGGGRSRVGLADVKAQQGHTGGGGQEYLCPCALRMWLMLLSSGSLLFLLCKVFAHSMEHCWR